MQLNSFVDVIRGLESGRTLERIDDQMQELLQRIQSTGKKGTLTIKLEVKPQANSDVHMVQPTITMNPPTFDPAATPVYMTDDAHLSLRNPRQPDIFERPKSVDGDEETKAVDDDEAATA